MLSYISDGVQSIHCPSIAISPSISSSTPFEEPTAPSVAPVVAPTPTVYLPPDVDMPPSYDEAINTKEYLEHSLNMRPPSFRTAKAMSHISDSTKNDK